MNSADFKDSRSGRLVRTVDGQAYGFVPALLPPDIQFDRDLLHLVVQAESSVSELSGLGRTLPNPHSLITPYLKREAVLSSKIEGTETNLVDLFQDEIASGSTQRPANDLQEVRNYVDALDYGMLQIGNFPLSLRLVKQLHARLMSDVRGDESRPGEFRESQNWIGSTRCPISNATFVPPPVQEMKQALNDWELFLHEDNKLPDLVVCAMMHYQFETIHPFADGNGRIGRLLNTLFLMQRGRLLQPLLYLSAYFEANRQRYYELLQRVRTHHDWKSWLEYFLTGVLEIAKQAIAQTIVLTDLREHYRKALMDKPKSQALVDKLFVNPFMTVSRAERILDVTTPTARQAIRYMIPLGLMEERPGRGMKQMYLARPILDAMEYQTNPVEQIRILTSATTNSGTERGLVLSSEELQNDPDNISIQPILLPDMGPDRQITQARLPNTSKTDAEAKAQWTEMSDDSKQPYIVLAEQEMKSLGVDSAPIAAILTRALNLWKKSLIK